MSTIGSLPVQAKLKIVWLCSLDSDFLSKELALPGVSNDTAPWMTTLIRDFEQRIDVELHIISAYRKLSKIVRVQRNGIYYYLLPYQLLPIRRGFKLFKYVHILTHYFFLSRRILKLARMIRPAIVHLHGTEKPYYQAVLKLEFPLVVSIQGFVTKPSGLKLSWYDSKRVKIERTIVQKASNIISRVKYMDRVILTMNPLANLFHNFYPVQRSTNLFHSKEKNADLLFAARICREKGIEDLLHALKILINNNNSYTLKIVGIASDRYEQYLRVLIRQLDLDRYVRFIGRLQSHEEVFREILSSRITVLPTYYDTTPGTLIESMLMGVPVIAYAVGGIPELLDDGRGLLVEERNIDGLATAIEKLAGDASLQKMLATNAKAYSEAVFDEKLITSKMLDIYRSILDRNRKTAS
jgi:glycosyltransferase involved in cell wall biosynthesis